MKNLEEGEIGSIFLKSCGLILVEVYLHKIMGPCCCFVQIIVEGFFIKGSSLSPG